MALYVGGMGHRSKNFHKAMMVERGFGEAAERIQELFLAGRKDEATAAVPDDFVDEGALVDRPGGSASVPGMGGLRNHGHDGVDAADRGHGADGEHYPRERTRPPERAVGCSSIRRAVFANA